MRGSRLICLEGMPGSGKSTTSQRLWLHVLRNGCDARWVYEHDTNHPIWKFDEQHGIVESGMIDASLLDDVVRRWRRLAEGLADDGQTMILDGALFQTPIGFLLMMDVDRRSIFEFLLELEKTIGGSNPTLIYLRRDDVGQALRAICDERRSDRFETGLIERLAGTPYGRANAVSDFRGLTGFYERFVEIADELFERFQIPKLAVDPEVGWAECERSITDFLGLRAMEDPPTAVARPQRYVGRYKDAQSDDELEVAGDVGGLYLADARRTRLFCKSAHRFHVQSIGVELWFEEESAEKFGVLRLVGNLPGLSPVWLRS
jgi:thymidylate kinase